MQITHCGVNYHVAWAINRYTDGNLAIEILCADGPFGMLSTNVEGVELAPDEFCVKTWSENAPWAMNLLSQCPEFEDTGRRFHSGFVSGPIYRMLQVVG